MLESMVSVACVCALNTSADEPQAPRTRLFEMARMPCCAHTVPRLRLTGLCDYNAVYKQSVCGAATSLAVGGERLNCGGHTLKIDS